MAEKSKFVLFQRFIKAQWNGYQITWTAADLRWSLLNAEPNQAIDEFFSDIASTEIATGSTYNSGNSASGKVVAAKTVSDAGNIVVLDCANPAWGYDATGATDAKVLLMHEYNASASAARLVGYMVLSATRSLQNADGISIEIPSNNGAIRLNHLI